MSHNTPPKTVLPDDMVETVRQLLDDQESRQFAVGWYLADIVDELQCVKRADILRELALRLGADTSTLRDRETMGRFYPPEVRERYAVLTYSQLRACRWAGDEWEKYAKMAVENGDIWGGRTMPVAIIRQRIRADRGDYAEIFARRLRAALRLLDYIAADMSQPDDDPGRLWAERAYRMALTDYNIEDYGTK